MVFSDDVKKVGYFTENEYSGPIKSVDEFDNFEMNEEYPETFRKHVIDIIKENLDKKQKKLAAMINTNKTIDDLMSVAPYR
jgi:hypothetical protein